MSKLYCSEITWKKNIENFTSTIIPAENEWVFVNASNENGYAIKSNGTLWTWGNNNIGQLGNNTLITSMIPTQEILGLTNWTYVAGTIGSTAAITSMNELYHSGGEGNVRRAMNQTSITLSFIKYTFNPIQFKSILMKAHIGGLDINGHLYLAGNNNYGQCAQLNTSINYNFKREYSNSIWTSFALGLNSTHGIKSDGTLWSIGINTYGNLGNNTIVNSIEFVQEATFSTNWKQVVSHIETVCAIKTDGTLWTWGRNERGILGINSLAPTFVSAPIQEITKSTNWSYISMGQSHILALKTNGSLFAWGSNTLGQLGINSGTLSMSIPTIVLNGTQWSSVSTSSNSSYGIKTDGTLWSWGNNNKFQLGLNDTVTRIKPTQILLSPISTTSTSTTSTLTTPSPITTTQAPTTSTTSQAPTSQAPTSNTSTSQAPTSQAPTTTSTTSQAPTSTTSQAPTSQAPTSTTTTSTTTQAPTTSTTSQAPTSTTSQAPISQAPTSTTTTSTTQAPTTSTTSQAPTSTTSQAPTTSTSQAPTTSTTSQAPTTTTSQAPTSTTSQAPTSTTSTTPQAPTSTTTTSTTSTTPQAPTSTTTTSITTTSTTQQAPISTPQAPTTSTTPQAPTTTISITEAPTTSTTTDAPTTTMSITEAPITTMSITEAPITTISITEAPTSSTEATISTSTEGPISITEAPISLTEAPTSTSTEAPTTSSTILITTTPATTTSLESSTSPVSLTSSTSLTSSVNAAYASNYLPNRLITTTSTTSANPIQYIGTNKIKIQIPNEFNSPKLAEYIVRKLNCTITKMVQDNDILFVYVEDIPSVVENFNDNNIKNINNIIFVIDSKEKRDMLLQMDLNKILNECNCKELKQTNKIDIIKVLLFIMFLIIFIIIIKYITK
jgi:alpha-tubulin suppressor-like RCC1 family protein